MGPCNTRKSVFKELLSTESEQSSSKATRRKLSERVKPKFLSGGHEKAVSSCMYIYCRRDDPSVTQNRNQNKFFVLSLRFPSSPAVQKSFENHRCCTISETQRRIRANNPDFNAQFNYAVSESTRVPFLFVVQVRLGQLMLEYFSENLGNTVLLFVCRTTISKLQNIQC